MVINARTAMRSEDQFFQGDERQEMARRYYGFLTLSLEEFSRIQQRLLLEQIRRVADAPLYKELMGGTKMGSVDEFRQEVPLTGYKDYESYLEKEQEDDGKEGEEGERDERDRITACRVEHPTGKDWGE